MSGEIIMGGRRVTQCPHRSHAYFHHGRQVAPKTGNWREAQIETQGKCERRCIEGVHQSEVHRRGTSKGCIYLILLSLVVEGWRPPRYETLKLRHVGKPPESPAVICHSLVSLDTCTTRSTLFSLFSTRCCDDCTLLLSSD